MIRYFSFVNIKMCQEMLSLTLIIPKFDLLSTDCFYLLLLLFF